MDVRHRGLVLPDLADLFCDRLLDRLCTQKRPPGRCADYAYISASTRIILGDAGWEFVVYVPDTNKLTLLKIAKAIALAIFYSACKICVRMVAPEPPMFCAIPIRVPSTCVGPHSPRSCCTTSTI